MRRVVHGFADGRNGVMKLLPDGEAAGMLEEHGYRNITQRRGISMRNTTWRAAVACALLLPSVLSAETVTEPPPAFQMPPAMIQPLPPAPPLPGTPDAPLLSNEPMPSAPPPPPLSVSGALPAVTSLPGVASAAPRAEAESGPASFQPPVTAVMPPPPPSPLAPPTSVPFSAPPAMPEQQAAPMRPFPAFSGEPAQTAMQQPTGGIVLTLEQAAVVRRLSRSLAALRHLVDEPRSNEAIGQVLNTGKSCAALLGLGAFPVMPRFEARSDETVVRDRSYDSWEYRKYGAFQTRLDGRIRPVAGHVHADLAFKARGRSGVVIRGSMTQIGALDGKLSVEGTDAWGRPWKIALQMDGLILRDDGLPSGGMLSLTGSDPSGSARSGHLTFPMPDPVLQKAKTERRKNQRRERRY